jgi:predicted transcriptional regulator of viral defense system
VAIAALAGRQHGVVSRAQLLRLGVTRHEIDDRRSSGRLHPIHRGVCAVGHRVLSREGEWVAAVLAGGKGAVLSHESAAALWELRARNGREIDVTVDKDAERPGIRFHRAQLDRSEFTQREGIPVTTPERTIIDIAATLTPTQLERAIRQAEYEQLTTLAALTSCLSSRRPGIAADCVWHEQRVIVELDGRAAHHNVHSFESDRARDRALQVAGWTVIRITWRQLHDEPEAIARDLYSLLAPPERRS